MCSEIIGMSIYLNFFYNFSLADSLRSKSLAEHLLQCIETPYAFLTNRNKIFNNFTTKTRKNTFLVSVKDIFSSGTFFLRNIIINSRNIHKVLSGGALTCSYLSHHINKYLRIADNKQRGTTPRYIPKKAPSSCRIPIVQCDMCEKV